MHVFLLSQQVENILNKKTTRRKVKKKRLSIIEATAKRGCYQEGAREVPQKPVARRKKKRKGVFYFEKASEN